jgi:hypothetical protein
VPPSVGSPCLWRQGLALIWTNRVGFLPEDGNISQPPNHCFIKNYDDVENYHCGSSKTKFRSDGRKFGIYLCRDAQIIKRLRRMVSTYASA